MKFNLKNRPKLGSPYPDDTTGYNYVVYHEQMEKWFEGFEKELRDILKEEVYGDELYYRICDSCVMRNTCLEYGFECEALQKLKEILGVERK